MSILFVRLRHVLPEGDAPTATIVPGMVLNTRRPVTFCSKSVTFCSKSVSCEDVCLPPLSQCVLRKHLGPRPSLCIWAYIHQVL